MLQTFLFTLTVCIDTFITGFSYGVSKIRIPILSATMMNLICSLMIGISLCLGNILKAYLPVEILPICSFILLFILGIVRLSDGLIKNYIKRKGPLENQVQFSFLNFKFILHVYTKPESADLDFSKHLSLKESISLGIALSLDGLLIGFGAALAEVKVIETIVMTFLLGFILLIMGLWIGESVQKRIKMDLAYLGGIFLIILALSRL